MTFAALVALTYTISAIYSDVTGVRDTYHAHMIISHIWWVAGFIVYKIENRPDRSHHS